MAEAGGGTEGAAGCVQRAYLYLVRDVEVSGPPFASSDLAAMAFDPDEVTRLTGLQPTESSRSGDRVSGTSRLRRFSQWTYELPEVRSYDTEEVVLALLGAIEPYAEGIHAACRTLGMRAGVMVVITMYGDRDTDDGGLDVSTASIAYGAQTLRRLTLLGLSVEHDQYVFLLD
ncbi:DUF4279 domain-containing protein [Solwaraspora sp. WMMD1047]|uniref:DUF4279 domain-containing protein n=1 Tax=Solwaraspora sp. WMMD1047 TaxID=3016102 RepID=UPI002417A15C|nr:DUF4279 domain-containing protein [Solwaraspora sp. WMMD1047]MDG4829053.1 DUF4279 domain-containing protein [Solwaraspora sp. WMMD1047]